MSKAIRNTTHATFSVSNDQVQQMKEIRESEGIPNAVQIRQALKMWFASRSK